MTLIKSISGIRGTIGGQPGDNLTPIDLAKFTSAYAQWLKETSGDKRLTVVVGRDARLSGFDRRRDAVRLRYRRDRYRSGYDADRRSGRDGP